MGKKFEKDTLKKFLQLAVARIEVVRKKKKELNKKEMACVAALVAEKNIDSAILKVEAICRDDMINEAYDVISHNMDIIVSRIALLESNATCEQTILQPIMLLIWAEPRIKNEIPEIENIVKQFEYKFGKPFIMSLATTQVHMIPKIVYKSLTTIIPPAKTVDFYLKNISSVFKVPYETPEELTLQILSQSASKINSMKVEGAVIQHVSTVAPTTQPMGTPIYGVEELDAVRGKDQSLLKRICGKKGKKGFEQVDQNFGSVSDQSFSTSLNTSANSNFGYVDTPIIDDSLNSSTDAGGVFNSSRSNVLDNSALNYRDHSDDSYQKKKPYECINDNDDEYTKKKPYEGMNDDDDEYIKKPLKFVNDNDYLPPTYTSEPHNIRTSFETPAPPKYEYVTEKYIVNEDPAPSSHSITAVTQGNLIDLGLDPDSSPALQPHSGDDKQQINDDIQMLEERLKKFYNGKR